MEEQLKYGHNVKTYPKNFVIEHSNN